MFTEFNKFFNEYFFNLALEDTLSRDDPGVWLQEVAKSTYTVQSVKSLRQLFATKYNDLTESELLEIYK